MLIEKLILENYRIFTKREFNFRQGLNLVLGNNSTGKTTILESIFFLFSGELVNNFSPINHNQNFARVFLKFIFNDIFFEISAILKRKNSRFDKTLILNEKKIESYKILKNKFLSPFLLNAFDISFQDPENKRSIIDRFLKIINPEFSNIEYNLKKVIKQKTSILKSGNYSDIIEPLNSKISELSSLITFKRIEGIKSIGEDLNNTCRKFWHNIENIKIIYTPGFNLPINLINQKNIQQNDLKEQYLKAIKINTKKEAENQKVLVSSNRDNFEFVLITKQKEYFIKNIFSQSQINIFILLFFLNLVKQIKKVYNYYPILLLDEPFVFLDSLNTEKILKILYSYPQVIISSNKDLELINHKIFL